MEEISLKNGETTAFTVKKYDVYEASRESISK